MEYKLCEGNGPVIRCDFDCRKCANLVHDALTDENKILKKKLEKRDKERDGFINEIKRITEERNRIHDEVIQANEDIESLNNKNWDYGFQIMSKNQKIMELEEKCAKLEKENDYLDCECESLLARFSERIAELEKENDKLDKEREKLRDDNSRLAHGFKDYIANTSELAKECDELRMMNDTLRTMNSDLLYRNGLLMEKSDPVIFQYSYGELSDKIKSLKEDIIRLDKCLSRRPCVKMEREEEE